MLPRVLTLALESSTKILGLTPGQARGPETTSAAAPTKSLFTPSTHFRCAGWDKRFDPHQSAAKKSAPTRPPDQEHPLAHADDTVARFSIPQNWQEILNEKISTHRSGLVVSLADGAVLENILNSTYFTPAQKYFYYEYTMRAAEDKEPKPSLVQIILHARTDPKNRYWADSVLQNVDLHVDDHLREVMAVPRLGNGLTRLNKELILETEHLLGVRFGETLHVPETPAQWQMYCETIGDWYARRFDLKDDNSRQRVRVAFLSLANEMLKAGLTLPEHWLGMLNTSIRKEDAANPNQFPWLLFPSREDRATLCALFSHVHQKLATLEDQATYPQLKWWAGLRLFKRYHHGDVYDFVMTLENLFLFPEQQDRSALDWDDALIEDTLAMLSTLAPDISARMGRVLLERDDLITRLEEAERPFTSLQLRFLQALLPHNPQLKILLRNHSEEFVYFQHQDGPKRHRQKSTTITMICAEGPTDKESGTQMNPIREGDFEFFDKVKRQIIDAVWRSQDAGAAALYLEDQGLFPGQEATLERTPYGAMLLLDRIGRQRLQLQPVQHKPYSEPTPLVADQEPQFTKTLVTFVDLCRRGLRYDAEELEHYHDKPSNPLEKHGPTGFNEDITMTLQAVSGTVAIEQMPLMIGNPTLDFLGTQYYPRFPQTGADPTHPHKFGLQITLPHGQAQHIGLPIPLDGDLAKDRQGFVRGGELVLECDVARNKTRPLSERDNTRDGSVDLAMITVSPDRISKAESILNISVTKYISIHIPAVVAAINPLGGRVLIHQDQIENLLNKLTAGFFFDENPRDDLGHRQMLTLWQDESLSDQERLNRYWDFVFDPSRVPAGYVARGGREEFLFVLVELLKNLKFPVAYATLGIAENQQKQTVRFVRHPIFYGKDKQGREGFFFINIPALTGISDDAQKRERALKRGKIAAGAGALALAAMAIGGMFLLGGGGGIDQGSPQPGAFARDSLPRGAYQVTVSDNKAFQDFVVTAIYHDFMATEPLTTDEWVPFEKAALADGAATLTIRRNSWVPDISNPPRLLKPLTGTLLDDATSIFSAVYKIPGEAPDWERLMAEAYDAARWSSVSEFLRPPATAALTAPLTLDFKDTAPGYADEVRFVEEKFASDFVYVTDQGKDPSQKDFTARWPEIRTRPDAEKIYLEHILNPAREMKDRTPGQCVEHTLAGAEMLSNLNVPVVFGSGFLVDPQTGLTSAFHRNPLVVVPDENNLPRLYRLQIEKAPEFDNQDYDPNATSATVPNKTVPLVFLGALALASIAWGAVQKPWFAASLFFTQKRQAARRQRALSQLATQTTRLLGSQLEIASDTPDAVLVEVVHFLTQSAAPTSSGQTPANDLDAHLAEHWAPEVFFPTNNFSRWEPRLSRELTQARHRRATQLLEAIKQDTHLSEPAAQLLQKIADTALARDVVAKARASN